MFILINNQPVNIFDIAKIIVEDQRNLINNLYSIVIDNSRFKENEDKYQISQSIEEFKSIRKDLLLFNTTFRIKIIFKDKTILYSKSTNFYTEIDAINKMKDLCILCNTIEASLPKISM